MSVPFNIETSFAGAEISDCPLKEALEGLDRMILCLCIIYAKLSIYVNTFSFYLFVCLSSFLFFLPSPAEADFRAELSNKSINPRGGFRNFLWGGAHLKELEKMMYAVIGRAKN